MGFDNHMIAGDHACPTFNPADSLNLTSRASPHYAEALQDGQSPTLPWTRSVTGPTVLICGPCGDFVFGCGARSRRRQDTQPVQVAEVRRLQATVKLVSLQSSYSQGFNLQLSSNRESRTKVGCVSVTRAARCCTEQPSWR
jgi:hypothetical protein